MATGGEEVDSRVTCSVCLEPYRGRQPKLLPCFHTFCVPCLTGLATRRDFTQVSDTPALDPDEEEGGSPDIIVTCPTCRCVIPVPAGGVTAFQTNFYVDSSSREEDGQPVPCTLCDGDQTAQFHCSQCLNNFCPQCQRYHDKLCRGGQVRALQDPSDSSSSSAAQSPSHRQVRQQLQKVEAALKKLAEEERKLNQEREAMDDSISVRYATLLRQSADAHDTCCLSLREVCDGLTERLHSSMAEARQTRDTLQQQLSSSQPAPVSASQLRAALFMEGELPMILDRDLGSGSLLQYHTEDNTSLVTDAVQSFMGKIVRASLSSGPAQSQAPSGSPCFEDSPGAMSLDGADPKSLNDLYKKVEDLAGQVTSLQSTNTQLSQQVTQLSTAHSKLSTEQSALRREVKDRNVQLTSDQADLRREVRAMRDKHAIVHQDLAVLTAEKDKMSAELGKLQKDIVFLQTDTSSSTQQTDIVQLKADHGDVVAKLSSVQADITALQGDANKMKKDITALQGDDNKMKKDITALQGDDNKMKKDITALQGDDNKMKKDITALQGDDDKMKKDIMALQGEDNKMRKDITALQGEDNKMKKDITALQGEDNKMKKDITALQGEDNKMKKDITALQRNGTSMKDKLKSDMAKIQGNLSHLESRFVTVNTQVGFTAWMSGTVTTKEQQTLICDSIISNVGGGYDTQSGTFTAPVTGTYCFLANTSPGHSDVEKEAKLLIVVEGEEKAYVLAYGYSCSTEHIVVRVTAGQKVWLRSRGFGEYTFGCGWTSFSGALLQAEV